MTTVEQIRAIEMTISRIEHDSNNVIGGSKAYHSGMQTFLKPVAQRKVDKLNAQLDALLDQCEA
jgi:hypothetical protein